MDGHYQIGDLTFSVDGDLKELAHCQEIIREIKRAERDLKRVAQSDYVYLIYDQDLEGDQGTFDKMRLRAYGDNKSYDLDIGNTDKNPLGIYVGHDQNIRVYDYQSEEAWHLTRDGERVQEEQNGPRQGAEKRGSSPPDQPSQPQGTPQESSDPQIEVVNEDRQLISTATKATNQGNGDQPIGQEHAKVIWRTMQRNGLGESTYENACERYNVETLADLAYDQVKDLYEWVRDRVIYETEEDLPF